VCEAVTLVRVLPYFLLFGGHILFTFFFFIILYYFGGFGTFVDLTHKCQIINFTLVSWFST
jgi:hypothetical protein